MKVGFLGPRATFTELAVQAVFGDEESVPFLTIPECMDAVLEGDVDFAVVPMENTLEGSVNITLDYLIHEAGLPIIGEITAPIRQHLMVHPDNSKSWKQLQFVYSHSHAIAQCHKFLHSELRGVRCQNTTSTAAAAQYIQEHPEINAAAIGNELSAKEYGLEIVKENIHDFADNHTRFIILSLSPVAPGGPQSLYKGDKTSIMVTLPSDHAGALHQVLSAFAWRKLNLSKIESRPMKTGLGNYFFIIDVEMKMDEVLIPGVIQELEALGCKVKLLGSYPSFHLEAKQRT
ncbi:prephenate dehydratase [Bacillus canaveralius]|uniref:Prephenate dehydratase n=1 Tax=Bacillus canaveralius TaxID=1403243 RepID=A0A2N5GFH3_9BACI|nr:MULTISPECIES: prephenate dehydratase [Bacillus]PLR79493.1 prephenate dehydratase [Bacillus canaveralius]PLR83909.1 prephenate dehydratase [Bacillus sp. V33-4]PLR88803.1 prephenate dehydratase [Bacillus canaveralius]RSK44875.1 prephenate dehydratase [Bacillus canaveralius]